MNVKHLLAKPWVRAIIFLWGIVFPIVFIGLPGLKMVMGAAPVTMMPFWALVVWLLGPLAVSIILKHAREHEKSQHKSQS